MNNHTYVAKSDYKSPCEECGEPILAGEIVWHFNHGSTHLRCSCHHEPYKARQWRRDLVAQWRAGRTERAARWAAVCRQTDEALGL